MKSRKLQWIAHSLGAFQSVMIISVGVFIGKSEYTTAIPLAIASAILTRLLSEVDFIKTHEMLKEHRH